jgi:endonuclease/exonuclease/phosphatase (EEP) superfamily protein YafD
MGTKNLRGRWFSRLVAAASGAYAFSVVAWQGLRLAFGDRWWWLAGANLVSLYLFLPLVVLLPLALWACRQRPYRWAVAVLALPLVVLVWLYGGLFLPRAVRVAAGDGPGLRVMTLNVLYSNDDGGAVARLVRDEAPDVVCLQELNPRLAADLGTRLGAAYPHRALLPREGVTGLGIYSRYPLSGAEVLPDPAEEAGWWQQGAQAVRLELAGQSVWLVNVHALPPAGPSLSRNWTAIFEAGFRLREAQMRAWLDWLAAHDGPAVIVGDFNFGDQNEAHALMAAGLKDAHRQAGWGLGHTAPASTAGLDGVGSPSRLFRIDYVWYSPDWRVMEVEVGAWDGQSDHLPVFATLRLKAE